MTRAAGALALLLLLAAAGADARPGFGLESASTERAARGLLQAAPPDCTRIANCTACRYTRLLPGAPTTLACSTCAAGYRPSSNGTACLCAPGYYRNASSECAPCVVGSYCPGYDVDQTQDAPMVACGTGLTTNFAMATWEGNCVTLPGYGYKLGGGSAEAPNSCPAGTYSGGGTRAPCRKCGYGLVTVGFPAEWPGPGATRFYDCLAPAGSYYDRGQARPCPKATYTNDTGRWLFCSGCPEGVTTESSATTSAGGCSLAKPGYKVTSPAVPGSTPASVAKCEANTYKAVASDATSCTPCDDGHTLVTVRDGAASRAACVAPAGWGYVPDLTGATAGSAVQCGDGEYKLGANRRTCKSCGVNFKTTTLGATDFSACYVPKGWGTTFNGSAWIADKCPVGFYGVAEDTPGVRNLPCRACAVGMSTDVDANGDVINDSTQLHWSPADCVTLGGWGYSEALQTAVQCTIGSYSPGGNLDPCQACPDGRTTLGSGKRRASDCVIAPGYGYNATSTDAEPCPQGTYGLGDTLESLNSTCLSCPGKTWTLSSVLAKSLDDCSVCLGGYGYDDVDNVCNMCSANSYSADGSASCTSCPTVNSTLFQSAAGSTDTIDCVAPWTALPAGAATLVYNSTDSSYVEVDETHVAVDDCRAECDADASCMLFNVDNSTNPSKCYLVKQVAGSDFLAFKNTDTRYTTWTFDAAKPLGAALSLTPQQQAQQLLALTLQGCTQLCDTIAECVVVVFETNALNLLPSNAHCQLRGGSASSNTQGCGYKAVGNQMNRPDANTSSAPWSLINP